MGNCYYVINITNPRVVGEITKDLFSETVHYKNLITLSAFAQYDTLKEARAGRKKSGGIIVMGIK